MANGNRPTQNPNRMIRFKLMRLIVAVIVLAGLTVLITWLIIKPRKLVYSIDDASIHNYNLSNASHLSATYNFILRVYNPNKRLSIYHDKVDVDVLYDDETISRGIINRFYQARRNTTLFKLNFASHDVVLSDHIAQDLKVERLSGQVNLGVKLNARIRFKVGVWKSRHYHMKVSCAPIVVHVFSSSKGFQRTMCDVHL